MKNLKLKDGTVIPFTDTSTIYNLVGVYSNYGGVDPVRVHLTPENLGKCSLDDVEYEKIIPVGVSASSDMDGNVTAIFSTREMTDVEQIQEQLDTHEEEITEIQDVLVEE